MLIDTTSNSGLTIDIPWYCQKPWQKCLWSPTVPLHSAYSEDRNKAQVQEAITSSLATGSLASVGSGNKVSCKGGTHPSKTGEPLARNTGDGTETDAGKERLPSSGKGTALLTTAVSESWEWILCRLASSGTRCWLCLLERETLCNSSSSQAPIYD